MISIVSTLYKSGSYIDEFYNRIKKVLNEIDEDYEIILVNDGSPDNSWERVEALSKTDSKIVGVDLSRNFGHHYAMWAGLESSKGDEVFLIDCDLEEPPELLLNFYKQFKEDKNIDVIYGVQEKRKGGLFERITGNIFFKVFNFISKTEIPKNVSTVRLMKRTYLKAVLSYRETNLVINGVFFSAGFNQVEYIFKKNWKKKSSYSLVRKLELFLNSIISFSSNPLYYIFIGGLLMSAMSFSFIVGILIYKIFNPGITSGWASTISSIYFIGGIIISSIGVLGLYIGRVFNEVKGRPKYLIKQKVEGRKDE